MKTAIISDIHGNFEALKSVLRVIDKMQIKNIICLGDITGYFTQVNECCEELMERGINSILGNHDWYMISGGFCPRSKSVNDCLKYLRTVIKEKNLSWLRTLPIQISFDEVRMVHGGWTDPLDEYIYEPNEEYFSRIDGKIFFSGHTHLQTLVKFGNNKTYCNPGSVGQPRDNNSKSAFAVLEGNNIELFRVEYDMEKVFYLMKKAGFSDYYYGSLKTGARNLCKLS